MQQGCGWNENVEQHNQNHHRKQDDERQVGYLPLGEGDEVGNERCSVHDHDASQFLVVLRLQDEKCQGHEVQHNQRLVDHAGANLVGIARADEVNCSDETQQDDEREIDHLVDGYLRVVEQLPVVDELHEMGDEPVCVVGVEVVACREPVGGDDSYQGGEEGADAERVGEEYHHQPEYGQIVDGLYEHQGGESDAEEGIECPSAGCLVLVAVPDDEIEGDEAHCHDARLERRVRKSCHRDESQKTARHHAAVGAHQGIAVVEFHHQQGGDDGEGKLHPDVAHH